MMRTGTEMYPATGDVRTRTSILAPVAAVFLFSLFSILIALPLSSHSVAAAASIGIPSVAERQLEPIPGTSKTWGYSISGASKLHAELEGDYVAYAKIDDPDPDGGARVVYVTWTVPPEGPKPGVNVLFFRVTEMSEREGQVGGLASARVPMYMTKYADYPLLEVSMDARSQEKDVDGSLVFNLKSISNVPTANVRATYSVEVDGQPLPGMEALEAALGSVAPLEEKTVEVTLRTRGQPQGIYTVHATVTYDEGEPVPLFAEFRIGTFSMTLAEKPDNLYRGKINKVRFTVVNEWNQKIPDARMRVVIPGLGIEEKIPEMPINGFGQGFLTPYLEVPEDAELRQYDGYIEVLTDVKNPRDVFTLPFTVDVIGADETALPEQVVTEKPSAAGFLNPLLGAYLLVSLLIIINVILLLRQRKKE